jgi:regulator of cell morphogenesis and NO signaling
MKKIMLNKNMKMADIIHENYLLLPVINRFGIKLGFADKTIEEVCNLYKVDIRFFLEIINAFHDKNYFPEKQLQSFSMNEIVNYLKKTHEYFLDVKLVLLENYVDRLVENCNSDCKDKFALVDNFYKEYKKELVEHILVEDQIIYPYVLEIERVFKSEKKDDIYLSQYKDYSIKKYEREHEDVEEKLNDLKNLIIKYLPPFEDNNLSNALLFELFELENDLNDHQRIEDKVLVPKVIEMEEALAQRKDHL